MRMCSWALTTAAALALALGGCGDENGAGGMIITSDGRFLADSAENNRDEAVYTLDRQLSEKLAPHWCARSAIAELPTWADDREDSGEWRWQDRTDVTVELTGDGQAVLPIAADEIQKAVFDYLAARVDHARSRLTVTVTQTVSAERFAALAAAGIRAPGSSASLPQYAPPPAPAPAPTAVLPAPTAPEPASAGASAGSAVVNAAPPAAVSASTGASAARTYVVQAGDTLADISAVFYGSTSDWRRIVAANPGLDPGHLVPGTTLVIP
jgi:LysM repeat protein